MDLPPESYNPKALNDIQEAVKAAKEKIAEQNPEISETKNDLGDIATMAADVLAEQAQGPTGIKTSSLEEGRQYDSEELRHTLEEIKQQVIDKYEKIHTGSIETVENQSQEAEENVRNIYSDDESVLNKAIAYAKIGYFNVAKTHINNNASSAETAEEMNKALDIFILNKAIAYAKSGYFNDAKTHINNNASSAETAEEMNKALDIFILNKAIAYAKSGYFNDAKTHINNNASNSNVAMTIEESLKL